MARVIFSESPVEWQKYHESIGIIVESSQNSNLRLLAVTTAILCPLFPERNNFNPKPNLNSQLNIVRFISLGWFQFCIWRCDISIYHKLWTMWSVFVMIHKKCPLIVILLSHHICESVTATVIVLWMPHKNVTKRAMVFLPAPTQVKNRRTIRASTPPPWPLVHVIRRLYPTSPGYTDERVMCIQRVSG